MDKVRKTQKTFKSKWVNNPDLALEQTLNEKSEIFNWILNRNGFPKVANFKNYLKNKCRILDAGCGNGRVIALIRKYSNPNKTEIMAIDVAPINIAQNNLKRLHLNEKVTFKNADLTKSLKDLGKFDFIYCQEVLHHLPDPQKAFRNLSEILEKNGELAIYVYKKKAPVREYVDDYIREKVSKLSYKEAMKTCAQITQLGKILSEQKKELKVPKVDILEIESGRLGVQRFVYHYFMKCFWNPELSFRANTAINFDWYHPQICSRHTLEEVRGWFKKARLEIVQEFSDHYGITMRGRR